MVSIIGSFTCPRHTVMSPLPILSYLILTAKISSKCCSGFTEKNTDTTWIWSTWCRSFDIIEQRRYSVYFSLIQSPGAIHDEAVLQKEWVFWIWKYSIGTLISIWFPLLSLFTCLHSQPKVIIMSSSPMLYFLEL